MASPTTDPDVLLEQTNSALNQYGAEMPKPQATAFFNDWLAEMTTSTDPLILDIRKNLEALSALLNGTATGDIVAVVRRLGALTQQYAETLPPDDDTPPTGGGAQRPKRRKAFSDLAWKLAYMQM